MTVDSHAHMLYIARLDRVMLVDTQTGKLITEIGGLQHVHGIAFDTEGKLGYIADGGAEWYSSSTARRPSFSHLLKRR